MGEVNVLVTGGYGFIGSHLVDRLLDEGYQVRILDNLSTGKLANVNPRSTQQVTQIIGDITNFETVQQAVNGCEYVFHHAAISSVPRSVQDPIHTSHVNYGGTLNVLEAARQCGVRRVMFASSAAVYGNDPTLPKQESMLTSPLTPYGADKMASELMGRAYAQISELEFVTLRYFNVFGSRQDPSNPYSGVISIFCDCIRQDIPPTIYGDGLQSRDFIHVSDVVQANLVVMHHAAAPSHVFNVGRNQVVTLLDLIHTINQLMNKTIDPIYQEGRIGDIRHSLADNTALQALGWSPQIDLHQGLSECVFPSQGFS